MMAAEITELAPRIHECVVAAAGCATAAKAHPVAASTSAGKPLAPRNPLKWPFASESIWNMPIGSRAVYVHAGLSGTPGGNQWAKMPGGDLERIFLTPASPLVDVRFNPAGWSGADRCAAGKQLLLRVPMPHSYVIPNSRANGAASFLMPDGRTLVQTQPLTRCTAGGPATSMARFDNVDLYGSGISGAHGGSGLSAIGGSIRLGELRPGDRTGPRHVLKVNVYAREALYRCRTRKDCSRWPALASDSYAVGWYGAANDNPNVAMKMGALLAIPASTPLGSLRLETVPARLLAWTLQNYGAYVVDDTYAPGFDFSVEEGADGSKLAEFRADWGFAMEQKVADDTAWGRDIQRLVRALHVVDNNRPDAIGGGGTPRQPLAPPISPPESR